MEVKIKDSDSIRITGIAVPQISRMMIHVPQISFLAAGMIHAILRNKMIV